MALLRSTVVVTEYAGDDPHDLRTPLMVRGRAGGLVGWLLTKLGLSPDVELLLSETDVSIRTAGLRGITRNVVPLTQVASTWSAYAKPWWALLIAAVAAWWGVTGLGSDFFAAFFFLVVAAGAAAYYYLSKTTVLMVETTGGSQYGLSFKRSVIEGVGIDMATAERMAARLNRQVLAATLRERTPMRIVA